MAIFDIEQLVANLLPSALETISNLLGVDAIISNKSPVDEPVSEVYGVYAGDYVPDTVPDSTTIPETEDRECRVILTDGYSFVTSSSLDKGTIEANYCYVRYDVPVYVGEIITIKPPTITEILVKGSTGTIDTVKYPTSLFVINTVIVSQDGVTYVEDPTGDYELATHGINWSPVGNEPATGSEYTVEYQLSRIRKFQVIGQESLGMTQTIINRYVLSSLGD